jgi:hypothetical protein
MRDPPPAAREAAAPAGQPLERRDDVPARAAPEPRPPASPASPPRLGWLPFILAFVCVAALAMALWWTA